ncbi:MAG: Maf family protein [Lachnospiraceae bacterium]|nr:Maf family protein [Lachnospiraceae bacterium]
MRIILASASPRRKELLTQIGLEFTVCPAVSEEVRTKQEPAELVEELSRQKAKEVAARLFSADVDPEQLSEENSDSIFHSPGKKEKREWKDCVVIGADTIVACTGGNFAENAEELATCRKMTTDEEKVLEEKSKEKTIILGKPKDVADAKRMLRMLSGHTHQVYTGVTLIYVDENGAFHERVFHERTDVTVYPMTEEEIDRYIETNEPLDKAGAYGIQGRFAAYIEKINGDYNNVVGLPVARVYQELKKLKTICGQIGNYVIRNQLK